MKKILYITFLLFCACYISSCSEDRYYPGEIYQDVDDNGGDDGDDVVEKVNENQRVVLFCLAVNRMQIMVRTCLSMD